MATRSTDGWAEQFSSYINRHESPLSVISPNKTTSLCSNGKLQSVLAKAKEVINSLDLDHEPRLITLAFHLLYTRANDTRESLDIIRKHMAYIVKLATNQKPDCSRQELSLLAGVLCDSKKLDTLKWPQLLHCHINRKKFPPSIVASFYFFVIQGVLQDVSTLLHVLVLDPSKQSILWDVARSFLSASRFSLAIVDAGPALQAKYLKNKAKMLLGFIKITLFLLSKKPCENLTTLNLAWELKLLETEYLLGQTPSNDETIQKSASNLTLKEFVKDYQNSFGIVHAVPKPQSLTTTATSAPLLLPPKKLKTPQRDSQDIEINLKINKYLELLHQEHPELDSTLEIISFLKSYKKDGNTLGKLLHALLPDLVLILKKQNLEAQILQLSRLCFEFGNSHTSYFSLQYSAILDMSSCLTIQSPRDLKRTRKRIEFSLWKIIKSDYTELCKKLTVAYFESVHELDIDSSVCRLVSELISKDLELVFLFFGASLRFSPKEQSYLFDQILPSLAETLLDEQHHIPKIIYTQIGTNCSSTSLLKMAMLFKMHVDVADIEVTTTTESLMVATIETYNLVRGYFQKDLLKKIYCLVSAWLEEETSDAKSEEALFTQALNNLFEAGFYSMSREIIENVSKTGRTFDLSSQYNLDLLHCQCMVKMKQLDQIPFLLTEAGATLKKLNQSQDHPPVSASDAIRWKFQQIEYFFATNDTQKLETKLIEVNGIMRKNEFLLDSSCSSMSLDDRLNSILALAQYLLYASNYHFDTGSFGNAGSNVQFSLKLVRSLLRRSDDAPQSTMSRSLNMMRAALRLAFKVYSHVGLSREALKYLKDLQKLGESGLSPIKSICDHFHLSTSFVYAGQDGIANAIHDHYSAIKKQFDFLALDFCQNLSLAALESKKIERTLEDELALQFAFEILSSYISASSNSNQALSPVEVNDAILCLSLCCSSKTIGGSSYVSEMAKVNKNVMLYKAVNVLRYEMETITVSHKAKIATLSSFGGPVLPSAPTQTTNSATINWLIECKDCLLKMTRADYISCLDTRQKQEVYHLLRLCLMTLSCTLSENQLASDTSDLLLTLEDLSRDSPYHLHHEVSGPTENDVPEISPSVNEATLLIQGAISTEQLKTLLPKGWAIISLDICSISGDLLVTKIHLGQAKPILVNIPFNRVSFGCSFEDVSQKLKNIIEQSNKSTKFDVTSLVKTKEDRKNWWRLRFSLDLELHDLLEGLDERLFGGLQSVFGTNASYASAPRAFERDMSFMWRDIFESLPADWTIDRTVLDLFYDLNPFDPQGFYKEKLLEDLIEFTCPRLNIMATPDQVSNLAHNLEPLYQKNRNTDRKGHTVLILGDQCSQIPWESMSCLRGKSVSRMPSYNMVQDMLKKHHQYLKIDEDEKSSSISYVVNPGMDLKRTESIFGPLFSSMKHASGICGRVPTENELRSLIISSKVYVFMGHGGGEQYMRLSSLTKGLETERQGTTLPPALLMGCSSCAFESNGRLPTLSNVFEWLVRGSPAVVANLWDVTDKDIDSFTMELLQSWGLLHNEESMNLSDAVKESRNVCVLKYLNGAAPVVYGLPLYFDQL